MLSRLIVVLALLGVVAGLVVKLWPEPDVRDAHRALAEMLLTAMERGDYELFREHADKGLQRLTRRDFELLAGQNAPRLHGGHTLEYIDELERSGLRQSRWRVRFTNGGAEATMTLGVRRGRVATFSIR